MFLARGHPPTDDVHGRCDPGHGRTHGEPPGKGRPEILLQSGQYEFYPRGSGPEHPRTAPGVQDGLRSGFQAADRRFLAQQHRRFPGPGTLGLESRFQSGAYHFGNAGKSWEIKRGYSSSASSASSGKSSPSSGSLSRATASKSSSSSPSSSQLAMLRSSLELILPRYLASSVETSTASISSPLRFLKLLTSLSP